MDELVLDIVRKEIDYHWGTKPKQEYELFITWKCKTLQNWKYLVATSMPDNMYYEITFNGDKSEFYVDAYEKAYNVVVKQ